MINYENLNLIHQKIYRIDIRQSYEIFYTFESMNFIM